MKRIIALLLCLVFALTTLAACNVSDDDGANDNGTKKENNENNQTNNENNENNETPDNGGDETLDDEGKTDELDLTGVTAVRYTSLGEDDSYTVAGGDKLQSFFEEPVENFFGVCKYFVDNNYELYSYSVKNGNYFATFTKSERYAHVYWIECESELNVVTSSKGGKSLPPKEPEVTTGNKKTSVTQIASTEINGMGYVIQLADGSFIVSDGGYDHRVDELWNTLITLNGSDKNIVIRAWIMSHSHGDHVPAFVSFSEKYASKVTLETVMFCPLSDGEGGTSYNTQMTSAASKFNGAKVLYVHLGMTFKFCNVTMEILATPDDLYIAEPYEGSGKDLIDHNNTSVVFRVTDENGYSAIFLGDLGDTGAYRMIMYFQKYLNSDMCQISHHGVEDFPLIAYRQIQASILFYPCDTSLYNNTGRDADVRKALKNSKYTKEIILHETRQTREFGLYSE